jgi:hypothetical protein
MNPPTHRPVLLLGSVALNSARDVFESVAGTLDGLVKRIPDGETGTRRHWINWQGDVLAKGQGIDVISERRMPDGTRRPVLAVKPGTSTAGVRFGTTGYVQAAIDSHAVFDELKQQGRILPSTRFQVSLPTPLAVVFEFFAPSSVRTALPAYERRILLDLDRLVREIPPGDLAIQWDIGIEIARILEFPNAAKNYPLDELVQAIGRVADNVPAEVELGLHLCYGDMGHRHLVEPKDSSLMVDFANRLIARIERPIGWLHMPVPRDRDDDAYFAPIAGLQLPDDTELYLGLIHLTDGIEGARRRVDAALRTVAQFGVAAECGLGRRSLDSMQRLLELHRDVATLGMALPPPGSGKAGWGDPQL